MCADQSSSDRNPNTFLACSESMRHNFYQDFVTVPMPNCKNIPMTHLIVHYHLRPGGVSSVVIAQAEGLYSQGKTVAVLAASDSSQREFKQFFLPELDYSMPTTASIERLFHLLMSVAVQCAGRVIWHIHNPTLGCHPLLSACIKRLAEASERLILHIHDFAEDERPTNYAQLIDKEFLYPTAPQIHYCVLTLRDRNILMRAGLAEDQVSIVGNPVTVTALPSSSGPLQVLYACRGIDRKNLGEFLLLSALAPAGVPFATTLGPGQSRQQSDYGTWQKCQQELNLPVQWGKAELPGGSREQCVRECSHLVTTSVKEGFGLAFLESIAWRRPLFGRALPHIREDLQRHGINHPFLYDRIGRHDDDFAALTIPQKIQCLAAAIHQPESFWVECNGVKSAASAWLVNVLCQRECSLDASCLFDFSPQAHIEKIAQLAEHLAQVSPSPPRFLDAAVVKSCFGA